MADRLYASSEETRAYNVQLFRDWVKTAPEFSEVITKFESNPDALASFIDTVSAYMQCLLLYVSFLNVEMVSAATGGQTDDTRSLKYNGLTYILKDPDTDKMDPLMPKVRNFSKAERGWNHRMIAQHLCPAHNVSEFDANPQ